MIAFVPLIADSFHSSTGKTYRFRVHNVGVSTSLNLRIQNHNMALVETEGSYTMKQNFTNLDIHVGQSYSFLVTMDQNASSDYYIVASARFVNESLWTRVTGVALLQYSNSKGKASGPLPDPPNDEYDKTFSMNQARSIRFVEKKETFFMVIGYPSDCRLDFPMQSFVSTAVYTSNISSF